MQVQTFAERFHQCLHNPHITSCGWMSYDNQAMVRLHKNDFIPEFNSANTDSKTNTWPQMRSRLYALGFSIFKIPIKPDQRRKDFIDQTWVHNSLTPDSTAQDFVSCYGGGTKRATQISVVDYDVNTEQSNVVNNALDFYEQQIEGMHAGQQGAPLQLEGVNGQMFDVRNGNAEVHIQSFDRMLAESSAPTDQTADVTTEWLSSFVTETPPQFYTGTQVPEALELADTMEFDTDQMDGMLVDAATNSFDNTEISIGSGFVV
jgi:hypothetical protein